MSMTMTTITEIAQDFFAACEAGKGWEVCQAYCLPEATFAAQSEPLADVRTLAAYTLMTPLIFIRSQTPLRKP